MDLGVVVSNYSNNLLIFLGVSGEYMYGMCFVNYLFLTLPGRRPEQAHSTPFVILVFA